MLEHDYQIALTDAQRQALRDHVTDTWTAVNEDINDATTRPDLDAAADRMTLHVRVCAAIIDGEIALDEPMRALIARECANVTAYRDETLTLLAGLRAGDPDAVFAGMSAEVSERMMVDEIERSDNALAALDELLAGRS